MTTNLIKQQEGTVKVFAASGGDVTFTFQNVANGAGRISAQLDLGAAPRGRLYRYTAKWKANSTPTVGNVVRISLFNGDNASSTRQAGTVGTSDAAISSENDFLNCTAQLKPIIVDAASTSKSFQIDGYVILTGRYVSVGFWNASGVTGTNTAGDHEFTLQALYDDIQAAA